MMADLNSEDGSEKSEKSEQDNDIGNLKRTENEKIDDETKIVYPTIL